MGLYTGGGEAVNKTSFSGILDIGFGLYINYYTNN